MIRCAVIDADESLRAGRAVRATLAAPHAELAKRAATHRGAVLTELEIPGHSSVGDYGMGGDRGVTVRRARVTRATKAGPTSRRTWRTAGSPPGRGCRTCGTLATPRAGERLRTANPGRSPARPASHSPHARSPQRQSSDVHAPARDGCTPSTPRAAADAHRPRDRHARRTVRRTRGRRGYAPVVHARSHLQNGSAT